MSATESNARRLLRFILRKDEGYVSFLALIRAAKGELEEDKSRCESRSPQRDIPCMLEPGHPGAHEGRLGDSHISWLTGPKESA